jgi:hypothetical protein
MNVTELQAKLLKAARNNPPGDQVPYAFEKRIMARLGKPVTDAWSLWGAALWRAAAACVVAMVLLGSWSYHESASTESADFSQDFENSVFAALDEQPDSW